MLLAKVAWRWCPLPALIALLKTLYPYLLWANLRKGLRSPFQASTIALKSCSLSSSGTNISELYKCLCSCSMTLIFKSFFKNKAKLIFTYRLWSFLKKCMHAYTNFNPTSAGREHEGQSPSTWGEHVSELDISGFESRTQHAPSVCPCTRHPPSLSIWPFHRESKNHRQVRFADGRRARAHLWKPDSRPTGVQTLPSSRTDELVTGRSC